MLKFTRLLGSMVAGAWIVSALAAEPLLVYERTHAQVAHQDNTYRLVLFDDDSVEIHFPFYSPQAGSYRRAVTPAEREALLELAAPLVEVNSYNLLESIQRQRSDHHTVVTDADPVRIEIHDPARGHNRVRAPSPEIWARNLPEDHEMATVAEVAGRLAQWMRTHAGEDPP